MTYKSMEVVRRIEIPELSKKIKQARESDGRSVQVLATLADISSAYWYQLENGSRKWVSEEVMRRIESVLQADFSINFDAYQAYSPRTLILQEKKPKYDV